MTDHEKAQDAAELFQQMTPQDFAQQGIGHIAYVRAQQTPDGTKFVIYGANGLPLGLAPSLELAHAAALQNDLKAFRVN